MDPNQAGREEGEDGGPGEEEEDVRPGFTCSSCSHHTTDCPSCGHQLPCLQMVAVRVGKAEHVNVRQRVVHIESRMQNSGHDAPGVASIVSRTSAGDIHIRKVNNLTLTQQVTNITINHNTSVSLSVATVPDELQPAADNILLLKSDWKEGEAEAATTDSGNLISNIDPEVHANIPITGPTASERQPVKETHQQWQTIVKRMIDERTESLFTEIMQEVRKESVPGKIVKDLFSKFHMKLLGLTKRLEFLMEVRTEDIDEVFKLEPQIEDLLAQLVPPHRRQEMTWERFSHRPVQVTGDLQSSLSSGSERPVTSSNRPSVPLSTEGSVLSSDEQPVESSNERSSVPSVEQEMRSSNENSMASSHNQPMTWLNEQAPAEQITGSSDGQPMESSDPRPRNSSGSQPEVFEVWSPDKQPKWLSEYEAQISTTEETDDGEAGWTSGQYARRDSADTLSPTCPLDKQSAEVYVDRDVFMATSLCYGALDMLTSRGLLLITGPTGGGKTTVGRALLRYLGRKGYTPKVLAHYKELRETIRATQKQVVLLDGLLDADSFTDDLLTEWLQWLNERKDGYLNQACIFVVTLSSDDERNALAVRSKLETCFPKLDTNEHFPMTDAEKAMIIGKHMKSPTKSPTLAELNAVAAGQNNDTALHILCRSSKGIKAALLNKLIDMGAALDAKNKNGLTPLQEAALCNRTSAVEVLLTRGANKEATDNEGRTALHLACSMNRQSVAQFLLNGGVNLEATDNEGRTPLHYVSLNLWLAELLLKAGSKPDARCHKGWTPLHYAACVGGLQTVHILIKHGSVVDATDTEGRTPLLFACERGYLDIVNCLLKHGAYLHHRDNSGDTVLHKASSMGHFVVVETLLNNGTAADAQNHDGRTPLHHTSSYHRFKNKCIEMLVAHGAKIDGADKEGYTALHIASTEGNADNVKILLGLGANVEARTSKGHTPFFLSCMRGSSLEVRYLLLDEGADINAPDTDGSTPLNFSLQEGDKNLSRWLLDVGADPRCLGRVGQTALNAEVPEATRTYQTQCRDTPSGQDAEGTTSFANNS